MHLAEIKALYKWKMEKWELIPDKIALYKWNMKHHVKIKEYRKFTRGLVSEMGENPSSLK